jgi:hypothetical protein
MKRPINRALISIQRRRCYRITAASTQQRPPHQLPCAVHRPRSRHLTPSASRPDAPPRRPSGEVGLAPGLNVWAPSSGSAGLPGPLRQKMGWTWRAVGRMLRRFHAGDCRCATRSEPNSCSRSPPLLHRPDTAFRASRVAPAGPTHVVSTRTGEPPAGSRPRGWRCWTKTGNKHSSSRNVLGASPPSWPAPATSRIALVAAHDLLAQARRRSHHRGRDCAGIVARSSGRCLSAGWPRGAGYLRLHRGPATYR